MPGSMKRFISTCPIRSAWQTAAMAMSSVSGTPKMRAAVRRPSSSVLSYAAHWYGCCADAEAAPSADAATTRPKAMRAFFMSASLVRHGGLGQGRACQPARPWRRTAARRGASRGPACRRQPPPPEPSDRARQPRDLQRPPGGKVLGERAGRTRRRGVEIVEIAVHRLRRRVIPRAAATAAVSAIARPKVARIALSARMVPIEARDAAVIPDIAER